MSSRPDNVAVENPAQSQPASAGSSTTCKELSDHDWVAQRYDNFRLFVGSLVVQEPKLEEWSLWLDRLPMTVFLAGGDGELKGVRGASTNEKRADEADLVLQRFALEWDVDLGRITAGDKLRLTRYLLLFSTV